MQIQDKGIIISILKRSQSSLIIRVLSENNGIYSGFVRGASSKRKTGLYQIGNIVDFVWSAKDANNLGYINIDLIKSHSIFIFERKINLYIFNTVIKLIETFLPERQNENLIYNHLLKILNLFEYNFNKVNILKEYILFEKNILEILGIGLDLKNCAGGGDKNDLFYISPKTGRAVSKKIGEPYKDKLFILPKFLLYNDLIPDTTDIKTSLKITSHFIYRNLMQHHSNQKLQDIRNSKNLILCLL